VSGWGADGGLSGGDTTAGGPVASKARRNTAQGSKAGGGAGAGGGGGGGEGPVTLDSLK
jgi:hypothetical protein